MKKVIEEFEAKCQNCQHLKIEHQKTSGLLQEILILTLKWEDININFVVGFPQTQNQYDSIWVVVDKFTISAYFIPIKSTYSAENYERIFINEIVSSHGIPLSIILDRGEQFISRFWRSFKEGLGTKVKLSKTFHPKRMVKQSVISKIFRIFLNHV